MSIVSNKLKKISTISFIFILVGGTITYFSSSMDLLKVSGYILTMLGFLILIFIWPIESLNKFMIVFIFTILIGILSLIPLLSSNYFTFVDLQQSIIYPVTIFILLLYGYRIKNANLKPLIKVLMFIGLSNGLIALLSSLGLVSQIPLKGTIATGRYIFGTTIPSSAGLAYNVNYYATLQGTIFLLLISFTYLSNEIYKRKYYLFIGLILLSTLIGSSRGVLLGLILAILTIIIISYFHENPLQRFKFGFLFLFFSILLFIWGFQNYEQINYFLLEDLRFERGLNARDSIWDIAIDRWKEKPIFGWGSMSYVASDFIDEYGVARSFHNSYVTVLYRGGIALFVATYGLMLVSFIYNIAKVKNFFYINRFNIAIIVFFLFNALVRNFSFGGIGLLPLALGVSLSLCFYSNKLENIE